MDTIGSIEKLYRYPVKSMAGELLEAAFVGFSGVYGDRIYAFKSPAAPPFFPYFTGRDRQEMLLYKPGFRYPENARQPHSWVDAESYSIGIAPTYASPEELALEVITPEGETLAIDAPALASYLTEGNEYEISLCHSDRALTDARPLSLISAQSIAQLSEEVGRQIDDRRFRANIYLDLVGLQGFAEDKFIGRKLKLGERVIVNIVERDPRCAMITYDPDTGEADRGLLEHVNEAHGGIAGVYAAVLVEGVVKPGDSVSILD
jgi:hypothetical protein